MDTVRALFIAPYPELIDIAEKVKRDFPAISLETFVGNYKKAVEYATVYRSGSFDAFISRGGMASVLRSTTDVPVVSIDVSACDILRSIQTARMCSKKFAFVAYHGIAESCRALAEVLRFDDFEIVGTLGERNMMQSIDRLASEGIDLIIGDALAATYAEGKDLKTIQLTSSAESVKAAFANVISVVSAIRQGRRMNDIFRSILDEQSHGVLLFDEKGSLIYANNSTMKLMTDERRQSLMAIMPKLDATGSIRAVFDGDGIAIDVAGEKRSVDNTPYYAFFLIERLEPLKPVSSIVIETLDEFTERDDFIIPESEYIRPLKAELDRICMSDSAVFITGSTGSQRSSVARYIHWNGVTSEGKFVTVHCHDLTGEDWAEALGDIHSPLYASGGTIFFEEVDCLSPELQMETERYIRKITERHQVRLLSSAIQDIRDLASVGAFNQRLYMYLCPLRIHVPSLGERREDIPTFTGLYISRFNRFFGKQVAGVAPDALETLINHDWSMDITEFRLVIRRLVEFCEGAYITNDEVKKALESTKSISNAQGVYTLDLNRALDDIETDIIMKVLSEEGMNQSLAAKRLGVSRTTIWRKIARRAKEERNADQERDGAT